MSVKRPKASDFFKTDVGQIALARLKTFVPEAKVLAWTETKGIGGIRLDLVFLNRKGMTLESFYRVCEALNASPTWVLFGCGRRTLPGAKSD